LILGMHRHPQPTYGHDPLALANHRVHTLANLVPWNAKKVCEFRSRKGAHPVRERPACCITRG